MVSHETLDLVQVVLGGALFWLPGVAWTRVLVPRLPWHHGIPLSVVAAFTIEPAAMLALHMAFGVPITLEVTAFLAALLGTAGLVVLVLRSVNEAALGANQSP